MEKKSESICSWVVTKIKSLLGLSTSVKKNNLETLLNTLPEFPTSKVMDFCVDKDVMALSFASKKLNSKTKAYRATKLKEENLLDCILAILIYEEDIPSCRYFVGNCVDYKTGRKFEVCDYDVRVRTLRDFAEYFVKPKNNNKYNQLIEKLSDNYKSYNGRYSEEIEIYKANIAYVENLISIGCNKSHSDLWKERITITKKNQKYKCKKQIKNYEGITRRSYKRIYDSINKPENRTPKIETHHYIDAYEKLNNQK